MIKIFAVPLHPVEPTKPLCNAQIGGSFFFYYTPMKQHYAKTCLTPKQHIELLKNRGMNISDEEKAANYLTNIGYFRLSAYFYPLLQTPKENHLYKPAASFDKVMNIYRFDRKLRRMLFNEIEKVEVAIRSRMTNLASLKFCNIFWLTDSRYFNDQSKFNATMAVIDKELQTSKEDFITHFKQTYLEPYPPAWMIAEIIPLGCLTHIYMNLNDNGLKKDIAQYFGLQVPAFTSWLIVLGGLRNLCCHHARVWNRELPISPSDPKRMKHAWIDSSKIDKRRMYYRICMIRYLLATISPNNKLKSDLSMLFAKYPMIDTRAMGFPNGWENEPLWR